MRRTLLLILGSAALLVPTAVSGASSSPKLTLSDVAAASSKVTVSGRIAPLSSAQRKHARAALSLTDSAGKVERFAARPRANGRFSIVHTTKLTGPATLRARLSLNGHRYGPLLTRADAVTLGDAPAGGVKLIGTFKLDPGIQQPDRSHTGTYFQMFTPGGGPPLTNSASASADKNFTTLPPGSDGGFQTFQYQPAPSPAFSPTGDSLAARIVTPQIFFGTKFGILTAPTDPQAGAPDPLPEIIDNNGQLSGQITAWAAQSNGQSFNQGTPKPDGSLPGRTTKLQGTYDEVTHRFVLTWKSLIVGGPFNSFIGSWHLEGTFEPQAKSTGPLPLLPLTP